MLHSMEGRLKKPPLGEEGQHEAFLLKKRVVDTLVEEVKIDRNRGTLLITRSSFITL